MPSQTRLTLAALRHPWVGALPSAYSATSEHPKAFSPGPKERKHVAHAACCVGERSIKRRHRWLVVGSRRYGCAIVCVRLFVDLGMNTMPRQAGRRPRS